MTCHHHDAALGDYVDGVRHTSGHAADAAAAEAFEAHLAGCARCRALVEDLRAIRAAAGTLSPHVPPAHLWGRIAAATQADRRGWWSLWTFAGRQPLAVAAALLILAGGSWIAWRQLPPPPAPAADAAPGLQPALAAAEEYVAVIADLEALAEAEQSQLDPATAEVLQANLGMIDHAIGESRAALEVEPSSVLAQESLFDALRSKVALLQTTIALINEMRKGNQEGAARVASGLNP